MPEVFEGLHHVVDCGIVALQLARYLSNGVAVCLVLVENVDALLVGYELFWVPQLVGRCCLGLLSKDRVWLSATFLEQVRMLTGNFRQKSWSDILWVLMVRGRC